MSNNDNAVVFGNESASLAENYENSRVLPEAYAAVKNGYGDAIDHSDKKVKMWFKAASSLLGDAQGTRDTPKVGDVQGTEFTQADTYEFNNHQVPAIFDPYTSEGEEMVRRLQKWAKEELAQVNRASSVTPEPVSDDNEPDQEPEPVTTETETIIEVTSEELQQIDKVGSQIADNITEYLDNHSAEGFKVVEPETEVWEEYDSLALFIAHESEKAVNELTDEELQKLTN